MKSSLKSVKKARKGPREKVVIRQEGWGGLCFHCFRPKTNLEKLTLLRNRQPPKLFIFSSSLHDNAKFCVSRLPFSPTSFLKEWGNEANRRWMSFSSCCSPQRGKGDFPEQDIDSSPSKKACQTVLPTYSIYLSLAAMEKTHLLQPWMHIKVYLYCAGSVGGNEKLSVMYEYPEPNLSRVIKFTFSR